MSENKVYATFFGNEKFPVEWKDEEEKKLMWFYDDLHCPNPISPLYFDVGGWWGPTCAYFYRRFGAPIGSDWIAKKIGGYVYTAVVPPTTDADKIEGLFAYYSAVMPLYGDTFLDRWERSYIPELKAAADYMLDFDFEHSTIPEALIHMEDCLDLQERAFRIHWIMNYAQVGASGDFQTIYGELVGGQEGVDPDDLNHILISNHDRNWDSLRELWEIKQYVCSVPVLKAFFEKPVAEIMANVKDVEGGAHLLELIEAYRLEYGFKPLYTHEYIYKTWYEDPTPIYEAVKSYVETDYDFNSHYDSCIQSQNGAIERARARISNADDLARFNKSLETCLGMMTLTPDHHFYIDQSIYAHMRLMFLELGKMYVRAGKLADPEDIFMLEYEELRCLSVSDYPVADKVVSRRQEMVEAAKKPPRYWYGTVDEWQLNEELYKRILWGYPELFYKELEGATIIDPDLRKRIEDEAKEEKVVGMIKAIPGSKGIVEGTARLVHTPEEFDQIQQGDIMICKMTNPGWIVSFSKISGLVTDTGGALSHPAVVSREFCIPCVVGAANATRKIQTGMKVRVDGNKGTVEILG